jgi:hypothetical protein
MFKALAMACGLGCAMLPACSSSSTQACGTISGSYTDSVTVSSPSAPSCVFPGSASGAVTITGPGPDHNVTLPSIQGSCPATSSGCSLDVHCDINITGPSGAPAGSANLTAHWTFSETGFTGQSTLVLQKSDGSSCTWDLADTGAKE